jgi:hypothetical protein
MYGGDTMTQKKKYTKKNRKWTKVDVACVVIISVMIVAIVLGFLYVFGVIGTSAIPNSVVTPPSDDPTPIMYVEPEHLVF